MTGSVPFLPSTAPFSPEQRAWLNGYFVGLLSSAFPSTLPAPAPSTPPTEPLLVLFGSQTGTAEQLARRAAKEASRHGFAAEVRELNDLQPTSLSAHHNVLIITSTWGDGEPPDNATAFWAALAAPDCPSLQNLRYSVLALGDRNYSDFCGAGKKIDERLEALGAQRFHPRTDCDVDYESPASDWLRSIWEKLIPSGNGSFSATPVMEVNRTISPEPADPASSTAWSRNNPFPARVLTNRLLNSPGSARETRHFEISLEGSGLQYEPGDALGIWPENCPDLVTNLLNIGDWKPDQRVITSDGTELSMVAALLRKCDLRKPTQSFLEAIATAPDGGDLATLLASGDKQAMAAFLDGREIIDLLEEFPAFRPSANDFVMLLGKLQPRLYSISSSLRAFPAQVHLTVSVVRYQSRDRKRKGVCSTFLADRLNPNGDLPIFVQTSAGFRLPADPAVPIIMIGPGTGIAPFRAFLHHRQAIQASGRNWLFYGGQHQSSDFLYREELERFQKDGLLTRLDTAFSRDQPEKIYVQHRMLEQATEIWRWLEDGAHFYVCGDAKRMARDVDDALHKVFEMNGHSPESAAACVQQLRSQKRYQRDVY